MNAGNHGVYLTALLAPFNRWLERENVTEIMVNRPGEVWIESAGSDGLHREEAVEIDDRLIEQLAYQIARQTHQGINRERPLLAATLPDGARIQIISPPATPQHWCLAVRRHRVREVPIFDFAAGPIERPQRPHFDREAALRDPIGFIAEAVATRATILVSGGTSSGKTTFLNSLLGLIPETERILVVEDTPEIRLRHPNCLKLVAVKGEMGEARLTTNDLLQASLRMRPDRLVLGELRGDEAVSFLRAINTGHPGSFSTIHANSPAAALEQLTLMVMQAGLGLSHDETITYAHSVIDVVIQLDRTGGRRRIVDMLIC
ncbi:P-type DNA transfer ATPase VirB11 [Novosphingobium sp.]|uniref:P-type DNA transfer ATPase VirB11 n=1 Tax=Novosphingobium sp. TaxID=1874826 RepID=UPI00262E9EEB|nr:P-type DNA transfer ATPase VirB11 [Novosphingobium sp.]